MACCRLGRRVNVELQWGACHLWEFAMFAIVEDSALVVRDDPFFQLVHGPLLIDVDAFRGPGGEGGGESGCGGQSQACSVYSVLYRLW